MNLLLPVRSSIFQWTLLILCLTLQQISNAQCSNTTIAPSAIGTTYAQSGGFICKKSTSSVVIKGVCWSTSPSPTVNLQGTSQTEDGSGDGSFVSKITNLNFQTKYYVRAYGVYLDKSVVYGNEFSFTTLPSPKPQVSTTGVSIIQPGLAVLGGTVTYSGSSTVTQRGICWSTSPTPTISLATKTVDGMGTGSFTSTATDLQRNTQYYFRAYATNASGTVYGKEIAYKTGGRLTDIDGNEYETIVIGRKEWMRQNLKVTRYQRGEAITTGLDNAAWASYTFPAYTSYNNSSENDSIYGLLYNGYAIARGRLCPVGWHIPNWSDLQDLNYNYGAITGMSGVSNHFDVLGGGMKADSYLWAGTNSINFPLNGFFAIPGGYRGSSGSFSNIGLSAAWWYYYDPTNATFPYSFDIKNYSRTLNAEPYSISPYNGLSVRCVKD